MLNKPYSFKLRTSHTASNSGQAIQLKSLDKPYSSNPWTSHMCDYCRFFGKCTFLEFPLINLYINCWKWPFLGIFGKNAKIALFSKFSYNHTWIIKLLSWSLSKICLMCDYTQISWICTFWEFLLINLYMICPKWPFLGIFGKNAKIAVFGAFSYNHAWFMDIPILKFIKNVSKYIYSRFSEKCTF